MRIHGQSLTDRLIGRRGSLTLLLIIVNVLGFGLQSLADWLSPGWTENYLALSGIGIRNFYLWQFVTYMFLHGGVLHLMVNIFTLFLAGREVEGITGRGNFLGIYFLGGLIGGLGQVLLGPADVPLVGASAGVFALLIAFTTIYPEVQLTVFLFFVIPVRLKARVLAYLLVGFSLVCLLAGFMPEVGHTAHLGGCLVGWLYTKRLGYGNPLRLQRYFTKKRELTERLKTMSPEEFISAEIDPILDKIAREGIHSLTRMERKILEKGRDKIARKTSQL